MENSMKDELQNVHWIVFYLVLHLVDIHPSAFLKRISDNHGINILSVIMWKNSQETWSNWYLGLIWTLRQSTFPVKQISHRLFREYYSA
jgi:hypothetical protein